MHNRGHSAVIVVLVLVCSRLSAAPPRLRVRLFRGDLAKQEFITLEGALERTGTGEDGTQWRCRPATAAGRKLSVVFNATSIEERGVTRWSYNVANDEPDATICAVIFPICEDIRLADGWEHDRILWPSLYQGALIDDLTTQEAFERQASEACKLHTHLHGGYQGDMCLPLFIHLDEGRLFSITVRDPTHEVVTFDGNRGERGMTYQITTHPRIRTGQRRSFGTIDVIRLRHEDWHIVADRYRSWLNERGFAAGGTPHGDIATLMYSRWDGLRPGEAIRWAKALGMRDVLLWVVLYGRGDQYYPCYFPPPDIGMDGMAGKLAQLKAAGLAPYFYTNGYLLSPLQTAEDAREWTKKYPDRYPEWLAEGDTGYAETVGEFRAGGHDFAGPWLQEAGGILPLRVRRVDFHWGEFPIYFWHKRPFYAACVATPEWRKLFRDTARLHARLGGQGIFMDQVAAMNPELCSGKGHGHDGASFGLWNRAYLQLLRETKAAGSAIAPGFFIEAEGAADLYAQYIDKYLCNFGKPSKRCFPRLLRYTAPWTRTDIGRYGFDDAEAMRAHVERTLLLGCIFRAAGGEATGPDDPDDPRLSSEAARLLKAGVRARRRLMPYIDGGRYIDNVGLTARGCEAARWFDATAGILITAIAETADAQVQLRSSRALDLGGAENIDWVSGGGRSVNVFAENGLLTVSGLEAGLNLVLVPRRNADHS